MSGNSRLTAPDPRKLRNLRQYQSMSDDEFDIAMQKREKEATLNISMEERIKLIIDSLGADYALDDLNSNDVMMLRAMAQAMAALEDIEKQMYELRDGGVEINSLTLFEKLSKTASDLRSDISKFQNDLNITRKYRASDKAESVHQAITSIQEKARIFYKEKMSYIFCPKCNMLLATIWTHYPMKDNVLKFECGRILDEDKTHVCGHTFSINTEELMESHGTNYEHIPESMV